MAFENILKPIKIGPVEIRNRIAMAPMNYKQGDGSGFVSDYDLAYFAARAKGGTGLIITGVVAASPMVPEYLVTPALFHLFQWKHLFGMIELAEWIHEHNSALFLQLTPGFGKQARYTPEPLAPSAIPHDSHPEIRMEAAKKLEKSFAPWGEGFASDHYKKDLGKGKAILPRALTLEEIEKLEDDYAHSAKLALMSGADGIEVHACHGYLIHQFLTPLSNKRTDRYGGSPENRMRFLLNLVKRAKDVVGDKMAIDVRLSGDEHVPGGLTVEDFKVIAKECEKAGADCIHLSDGPSQPTKYSEPDEENDCMLSHAREFKKVLKIPVITPSIHDPNHAEKAIKEGMTDMISLGRQSQADPEWGNKVKANKPEDIVRCNRDDICLAWIYLEGRSRCPLNPNLGRERFMPEYWPKKKSATFPPSLRIKKAKKA